MQTELLTKIALLDNFKVTQPPQLLLNLIKDCEAVVEPLVITHEGVLAHGYKRFACAVACGMESVPVRYENLTLDEIPDYRMVVNRGHGEISVAEVANALLRQTFKGVKQADLAAMFSMTQPEVSNYVRLATSHPELIKLVMVGGLTLSAAEPLLALDQAAQEVLLAAASKAKTVRGVSAVVKAYKARWKQTDFGQRSNDPVPPEEMTTLGILQDAARTLLNAEAVRDPRLVSSARMLTESIQQQLSRLTRRTHGTDEN